MINLRNCLLSPLSLSLLCLMVTASVHAEQNIDLPVAETTQNNNGVSQSNTLAAPSPFNFDDPNLDSNNNLGWINYLPRMIDATPTLFPEQSNQKLLPPTEQTEELSWIDRKQKSVRAWTDRTAQRIDGWFGETDPNKPATASLRILLDNDWDEHDGYEFKPRIRGKIDLPTLERRFSLVFGDDSLDNELDDNIAITNEHPAHQADKKVDGKRIREDNSSIALRWSQISKSLPFDLDADLGIRSGDDVYARLKAKKDWSLANDFSFHAEQIYRYGIDSEHYLRTNLELTHARPNEPFISNQFYLTYADEQDDDLTWDNRTYRQHQFFHENRFNYGIYTGGYYHNDQLRLNSWGPFVSWRQPIWREWFYIQGDLNYFDDQREDRDHYVRALVRLEALF